MATLSSIKNKLKPREWDMMEKRTLLTLDLSYKRLTQLPEVVFELNELEALDLTNNENIDLSSQLTKLTNLKVLCLNGCNLDTVPASVMKLPQLEMLILRNNKNISLPDEMSGLINLTVLDLESCNLHTLPPGVLKLSNLKVLDLSADWNTILEISLPDELYRLNKLKVLRLCSCNLDTVPPAVLKLPQLEELDLSRNSGIRLPDGLAGLTNLRVLKLGTTGMDTVPSAVLKLSQLEELDLSENSGIRLPDGLAGLTNLRVLGLVRTGMDTVPSAVGRLKQLEVLDLSHNHLQTLSAEIGHLTNVKQLVLSKCQLRTLPPEVGRLTQLEVLDLRDNQLQTLPAEIGQLTSVKQLNLSGCKLRTLPPEVGRLTQLEWLDLRDNQLQTLPGEIGQLTNVKFLYLSDCELCTLPPEVGRLTQLEWLFLSKNQLQTLPAEIGHLTNAKHLSLGGNQLQTLPAEFGQLHTLCHIDVSDNPLIKPPAEVCLQGIPAIKQYFDELERSEENINAHLKVVVLGEKMAGKTSLVRTLDSGESTLTEEEDRTHCVEITQWAPDDNITFEVYDFGGHDVYHLTHQFFLTQGALNLLTVNLQEYGCNEQSYTKAVGFWLDTLNARVPGAVVTIVGSKMDLCSSTEIKEKTRDIQERFTQQHHIWQRTIQQQIKKLQGSANGGTDQGEIAQQIQRTRQLLTRPLRLTGVHCVSSAEPTSGLNSLMSHIMDTANNTDLFPTIRIILPKTWVEFEQQLRDLRKKGAEEHLSAESPSHDEPLVLNIQSSKWLTREECLQQGQLAGLSADTLEPVLSYLQQVGTILRYTDIPELKDLIFHDPSGLIDNMKELFHHDLMKVFKNTNPRLKGFSNTKLKKVRKNLSCRGFLPRDVVIALLGPHPTPVGNVDVITNLMEHFGLCYTERSDEQGGETSVPVGYFIPWYIQEERPEAINRDVAGQTESTVTCEITHFCPRGLFERLSVVVNKLIKSRQDWKDIILAVRDSLPVIVYRETKHEHVNIVVKLTVPAQAVQGTQMIWDAIGPLKDKLSALLKEWPGLLYRLVYSTFTQQGHHHHTQQAAGDQQMLACSSIIPTFAVGPRGCTVQHSGVTLELPAGCVRNTRFISVEVEAVPVNKDNGTNFTAMSAVLTVEQDFPRPFLRPVTVMLPWVWTQTGQKDEETRTVVLHYDRDEGWTVFPTNTHEEDGGIMFQTDHFQTFWVLKALQNWLWPGNEINWARQTWDDYIEKKMYVIITPDVNTLPERILRLILLYKMDNIHDFFQAPDVRFESQIKQRVDMTKDQTIEFTFGKEEDVGPDPRDLPEGESMSLHPRIKREVRLRVKESVPKKPIYEGKVKFTIRDPNYQTGTAGGPQFETFVKLRHQGRPTLPIFAAVMIAVLAVLFQLHSTGYTSGFWTLLDGREHVFQHTSYPGKPVVLLINDEYGTSKGGISTINHQLAKLLSSSGAKVFCTVLSASKEVANDARNDGIELVFPTSLKSDKRHPNLDWLTFDHRARYPHLPSDITHIIGHASITSSAARNIKEQRYPAAKLILFNHVIPEDTEHYKNESRELGIGEKIDSIRTDMEYADVVFSVGPYLHDYYRNQIRGSKPHHEFLPKPSDIFSQMHLAYVETETKVVLSIGRVKGAERLKGYDLAAKAMSMVISRFPKARWRVRGVSAEDFRRSKQIIQANKAEFHFTPLKYGKQPELGRDMKEAHVVLMPSRAEPFGLVGLEAIAAGVPLVVSDKSGLAWFFKTQDPGFDRSIVKLTGNDEDDARLLAERIEEILRDGPREFNAARGLKQKLLSSKYWEDSHRKFLEECDIV